MRQRPTPCFRPVKLCQLRHCDGCAHAIAARGEAIDRQQKPGCSMKRTGEDCGPLPRAEALAAAISGT
jgi:hypothetical protein